MSLFKNNNNGDRKNIGNNKPKPKTPEQIKLEKELDAMIKSAIKKDPKNGEIKVDYSKLDQGLISKNKDLLRQRIAQVLKIQEKEIAFDLLEAQHPDIKVMLCTLEDCKKLALVSPLENVHEFLVDQDVILCVDLALNPHISKSIEKKIVDRISHVVEHNLDENNVSKIKDLLQNTNCPPQILLELIRSGGISINTGWKLKTKDGTYLSLHSNKLKKEFPFSEQDSYLNILTRIPLDSVEYLQNIAQENNPNLDNLLAVIPQTPFEIFSKLTSASIQLKNNLIDNKWWLPTDYTSIRLRNNLINNPNLPTECVHTLIEWLISRSCFKKEFSDEFIYDYYFICEPLIKHKNISPEDLKKLYDYIISIFSSFDKDTRLGYGLTDEEQTLSKCFLSNPNTPTEVLEDIITKNKNEILSSCASAGKELDLALSVICNPNTPVEHKVEIFDKITEHHKNTSNITVLCTNLLCDPNTPSELFEKAQSLSNNFGVIIKMLIHNPERAKFDFTKKEFKIIYDNLEYTQTYLPNGNGLNFREICLELAKYPLLQTKSQLYRDMTDFIRECLDSKNINKPSGLAIDMLETLSQRRPLEPDLTEFVSQILNSDKIDLSIQSKLLILNHLFAGGNIPRQYTPTDHKNTGYFGEYTGLINFVIKQIERNGIIAQTMFSWDRQSSGFDLNKLYSQVILNYISDPNITSHEITNIWNQMMDEVGGSDKNTRKIYIMGLEDEIKLALASNPACPSSLLQRGKLFNNPSNDMEEEKKKILIAGINNPNTTVTALLDLLEVIESFGEADKKQERRDNLKYLILKRLASDAVVDLPLNVLNMILAEDSLRDDYIFKRQIGFYANPNYPSISQTFGDLNRPYYEIMGVEKYLETVVKANVKYKDSFKANQTEFGIVLHDSNLVQFKDILGYDEGGILAIIADLQEYFRQKNAQQGFLNKAGNKLNSFIQRVPLISKLLDEENFWREFLQSFKMEATVPGFAFKFNQTESSRYQPKDWQLGNYISIPLDQPNTLENLTNFRDTLQKCIQKFKKEDKQAQEELEKVDPAKAILDQLTAEARQRQETEEVQKRKFEQQALEGLEKESILKAQEEAFMQSAETILKLMEEKGADGYFFDEQLTSIGNNKAKPTEQKSDTVLENVIAGIKKLDLYKRREKLLGEITSNQITIEEYNKQLSNDDSSVDIQDTQEHINSIKKIIEEKQDELKQIDHHLSKFDLLIDTSLQTIYTPKQKLMNLLDDCFKQDSTLKILEYLQNQGEFNSESHLNRVVIQIINQIGAIISYRKINLQKYLKEKIKDPITGSESIKTTDVDILRDEIHNIPINFIYGSDTEFGEERRLQFLYILLSYLSSQLNNFFTGLSLENKPKFWPRLKKLIHDDIIQIDLMLRCLDYKNALTDDSN